MSSPEPGRDDELATRHNPELDGPPQTGDEEVDRTLRDLHEALRCGEGRSPEGATDSSAGEAAEKASDGPDSESQATSTGESRAAALTEAHRRLQARLSSRPGPDAPGQARPGPR